MTKLIRMNQAAAAHVLCCRLHFELGAGMTCTLHINMPLEELITVIERHYNSSDNLSDGSSTETKVPDLVYQITNFSKNNEELVFQSTTFHYKIYVENQSFAEFCW